MLVAADGDADFNLIAGNVAASTGTASVGVAAVVLVHNDTVEATVGSNAVRNNFV